MTGMLCSGTGGPPDYQRRPVTCPVCHRWWPLPAGTKAVPRHSIQAQQAA